MAVFIISAFAVAIMMLGLSITLINKGRDLQSDVGGNDDMKRLGLECASKMARREEAEFLGKSTAEIGGCGLNGVADCGDCGEAKTPQGCGVEM